MGKHLNCVTECPSILERFAAGESIYSLAMAFECSVHSITRHIDKHRTWTGQTGPKGAPGHRCHHCAEMVADYTGGESLETVGLRYGLTRERVRQLLALHGVRRRQGLVHRCDRVCAALLAEPLPLRPLPVLAVELQTTKTALMTRAEHHRLPRGRPGPTTGHRCAERCVHLKAALAEDLDTPVYAVAHRLGYPPSWVRNVFLLNHPEHRPKYRRKRNR